MALLGFIQTKDRRILEWVDFLNYLPAERHVCICEEYYPGQYFRIVDRAIGAGAVIHIDQIRLFFKIKK